MFLPDNIENKDDDGKKYWRIDSFVEQYIYIYHRNYNFKFCESISEGSLLYLCDTIKNNSIKLIFIGIWVSNELERVLYKRNILNFNNLISDFYIEESYVFIYIFRAKCNNINIIIFLGRMSCNSVRRKTKKERDIRVTYQTV